LIVYYIILSLILIFMLKNLTAYILINEKFYLGFFLILSLFFSIIIFNRILPDFIGRNSIFLQCGDIVNVILISGSVIFFSHHFLNLTIINPLTILYFYFELLAATVLLGLLFITNQPTLISSLAHLIVFIYTLIFFIIITIEISKKKHTIHFMRTITLLLMQLSFTIMTLFKALFIPIHILFYSGILIMIVLLEFEIIFKAKNNVTVAYTFNFNDIKEKDKRILELLFNGMEYKEIATKTGLTLNTIKKYINRIYREYDVKNKTELMNKFLRK